LRFPAKKPSNIPKKQATKLHIRRFAVPKFTGT
jgi:hypothetical protein